MVDKTKAQPQNRKASVVDLPPDIEEGADTHASPQAVAARNGADSGTADDTRLADETPAR